MLNIQNQRFCMVGCFKRNTQTKQRVGKKIAGNKPGNRHYREKNLPIHFGNPAAISLYCKGLRPVALRAHSFEWFAIID